MTKKGLTYEDFPRTKDKVAIVGFSMQTRHLAPYKDDEYEIWGLNEAYAHDFMPKIDRWFQLHPRWDFTKKENMADPNHWEWLQKDRDYPIYMQKQHDDVPNSVELPINEITDKFLNGKKYFTSSLAYQIGLAMLMGFKRIELWGYEMATDTEYSYQRANTEYWIGLGRGLGFDIFLPEQCQIASGKLYGYEEMLTPYRQLQEFRKSNLETQFKEQEIVHYERRGAEKYMKSLFEGMPLVDPKAKKDDLVIYANQAHGYVGKAYEDIIQKVKNARDAVMFLKGASTECDNLTIMFDDSQTPTEEIDTSDNQEQPLAYKQMQENVNLKYGMHG